jgi:hypothetical protein
MGIGVGMGSGVAVASGVEDGATVSGPVTGAAVSRIVQPAKEKAIKSRKNRQIEGNLFINSTIFCEIVKYQTVQNAKNVKIALHSMIIVA